MNWADVSKLPVFVYKQDPSQVGSGIYPMVACFCTVGAHVPFSYHAHAGDKELRAVGDAVKCDGSCKNRLGTMEDFAAGRSDHDYEVTNILRRVIAFTVERRDSNHE